MSQKLKLQALKVLMEAHAPVRAKRGFGNFPDEESIPLSAGNLIEVLGEGQNTFVVRFLKDRPKARVAWVFNHAIDVCPMSLAQDQVALSRILFLEKVEALQGMDVLLTLLKSGIFEVLVFDQAFLPSRSLDVQIRKLSLIAEEEGVILILLSKKRTSSYGIHIQVETEDAEKSQLRKVKGGL